MENKTRRQLLDLQFVLGILLGAAFGRRLGFRLVGIHSEVGQKFGRWLDLAMMELKL